MVLALSEDNPVPWPWMGPKRISEARLHEVIIASALHLLSGVVSNVHHAGLLLGSTSTHNGLRQLVG